jgi:sec-independent protein translocase protein TatA
MPASGLSRGGKKAIIPVLGTWRLVEWRWATAALAGCETLEAFLVFEGILQPTHLILILVIALVVFGPGKLPELGSSLGKGIKEFRQSMTEISSAVSTEPEAKPKTAEVAKPVEAVKSSTTDSKPSA